MYFYWILRIKYIYKRSLGPIKPRNKFKMAKNAENFQNLRARGLSFRIYRPEIFVKCRSRLLYRILRIKIHLWYKFQPETYGKNNKKLQKSQIFKKMGSKKGSNFNITQLWNVTPYFEALRILNTVGHFLKLFNLNKN